MLKNFNLKKIKEVWDNIVNDRQNLILFILAVASVVIATIYMVISGQQTEPQQTGYYENPFEESAENTLNWKEVRVTSPDLGVNKLELSSFKADIPDKDDIETVLARFGIVGIEPEELQDGVYSWSVNENTVANYTETTGALSINSVNGLRLKDIERGYIREEDVGEYFEEFVEFYFEWDTDFEYRIDKNGDYFRVSGTWFIEEYKVVGSGQKEDLFVVVFNEGGDLVAMHVTPIDFKKQQDKVDLVDIEGIKEYLHYSSYPKSEFIDIVSDTETECSDYDCYYNYDPREIDDIVINEAEIVYFFNAEAPESVIPVYKLTGRGGIFDEDDKEQREVSVTIYANAIDPAKIVLREED